VAATAGDDPRTSASTGDLGKRRYRGGVGSGAPYEDWLRHADDGVLEQFAAELTETLPPDDPMIVEVRYLLRRMRDEARAPGDGPNPSG
jgi:hypothetical protein